MSPKSRETKSHSRNTRKVLASNPANCRVPADGTLDAPATSAASEAAATPVDNARLRPKANTKLGMVLGLLEEPAGASLAKLTELTGWLPHTTRAALTGLRKRGFQIELQRGSDAADSVYRSRVDAA
ncbi:MULTISPECIES: DUF3489 domain-containing protein [Bosea]|uniref:DUF3489 domain-containing protein n=1 Tax=Bosea rubneri TaxID=3075434 RepID=A0ABU3SF40_9HYPH|nr:MULTISPECIES: DUF3489 domain-containing protein [unclassified Bosea (in: a-proteobacteria)]MDU0343286.1 DUF3489 domain-containing protein [Bosea sp. ZW T0_25]HEV7337465.1 DUF3489 domain-containing protein [Bosea sp. (in: a-proteobacteria)]